MALFFFKRKNDLVQFPIGQLLKTDMHSHILPGIDDGAPDVETSLQLIHGLVGMGYERLIATPHVMADIHTNNSDTIRAAYERLKQGMEGVAHMPRIHYAAEFMMDDRFGRLVRDKAMLPLGTSKYVLVETPYLHRTLNLESSIFALITAGYTPILAHPERYHYLFDQPKEYEALKERGCLFQVNLLSLRGYYGKMEKKAATWLLEAGMVDMLGTDLHHARHLKSLQKFTIERKLVSLLEQGNFLNATLFKESALMSS